MAADSWKAHAALALVKVNYGGYHIITKLALTVEMNQMVFSSFGTSWRFRCSVLSPISKKSEQSYDQDQVLLNSVS